MRYNTLSILILLIMLFVPASTVAAPGDRIAVMNFSVNSSKPELKDLGRGLSEMMTSKLVSTRQIKVVERTRLDDALTEQGLSKTGFVDETSAMAVGRLTGANIMAFGTITDFGSSMSVDIRLVQVETGEVINSVSDRNANLNNISEVLDRLSLQVASLMSTNLYQISGRIIDASGDGIAEAQIFFEPDIFTPVTSDKDGNWTKDKLWGSVKVSAVKGSHEFKPSHVLVSDKKNEVDFRSSIEDGYFISGIIKDTDGLPIKDALVNIISVGSELAPSGTSIRSSEDGHFAVENLRGKYRLFINKPGWEFTPAEFDVSNSQIHYDITGHSLLHDSIPNNRLALNNKYEAYLTVSYTQNYESVVFYEVGLLARLTNLVGAGVLTFKLDDNELAYGVGYVNIPYTQRRSGYPAALQLISGKLFYPRNIGDLIFGVKHDAKISKLVSITTKALVTSSSTNLVSSTLNIHLTNLLSIRGGVSLVDFGYTTLSVGIGGNL